MNKNKAETLNGIWLSFFDFKKIPTGSIYNATIEVVNQGVSIAICI
jgi:hypothetical protein